MMVPKSKISRPQDSYQTVRRLDMPDTDAHKESTHIGEVERLILTF